MMEQLDARSGTESEHVCSAALLVCQHWDVGQSLSLSLELFSTLKERGAYRAGNLNKRKSDRHLPVVVGVCQMNSMSAPGRRGECDAGGRGRPRPSLRTARPQSEQQSWTDGGGVEERRRTFSPKATRAREAGTNPAKRASHRPINAQRSTQREDPEVARGNTRRRSSHTITAHCSGVHHRNHAHTMRTRPKSVCSGP